MPFTKNIGFVDQVVRSLLIVDLLAPCLLNLVSGTAACALVTVSGLLSLSCLTSHCPLYVPFGFTTRREWEP